MEKEYEVIEQATNEKNEIFINRVLERRASEKREFTLVFNDGTKFDTTKYGQYGYSKENIPSIAITMMRDLGVDKDEEISEELKQELEDMLSDENKDVRKTQIINGVEYEIGEESEIMQDENGYYTLKDGERHDINDPAKIEELLAEKNNDEEMSISEEEKEHFEIEENKEEVTEEENNNINAINSILNIVYDQKMKNDENVKNLQEKIEILEFRKKNESIRLSTEMPIALKELQEKINANNTATKSRISVIDNQITTLNEELEVLKENKEQENEKLELEKDSYMVELDESKKEKDLLIKEFESKTKDLNVTNRELTLVELSTLNNEINQLENHITIIESQIDDINKIISDVNNPRIQEIEKMLEEKNLEKEKQNQNCINRNNIMMNNISEKYGINIEEVAKEGKFDIEESSHIKPFNEQLQKLEEKLSQLITIPNLEKEIENSDKSKESLENALNNAISYIPEKTLNLINNPETLKNEIMTKKSNIKMLEELSEKDYIDQTALDEANKRIETIHNLIKEKDNIISNIISEEQTEKTLERKNGSIFSYKGHIGKVDKKLRKLQIEINLLDKNSEEYNNKIDEFNKLQNKKKSYIARIEELNVEKIDCETIIQELKAEHNQLDTVDKLEAEKEKLHMELIELETKKHNKGFVDLRKKSEYQLRLDEEKESLEELEKIAEILNGKTIDQIKDETIETYSNSNDLYDEVEVKLSKASIKDIALEAVVDFKNAGKNLLDKISNIGFIKKAKEWLNKKYNKAKMFIAAVAVAGTTIAGANVLSQNSDKQADDINKMNNAQNMTTEYNSETKENTSASTIAKLEAVKNSLNEFSSETENKDDYSASLSDELNDALSAYINNGPSQVSTTAEGAITGDTKDAYKPAYENANVGAYYYRNEAISEEDAKKLHEAGEKVSALVINEDGEAIAFISLDKLDDSKQIKR